MSTAAADPRFLLGRDLGTVIRVEGVDAECLGHPRIDQIARRFEAALRMFDEGFRLYVAIRRNIVDALRFLLHVQRRHRRRYVSELIAVER